MARNLGTATLSGLIGPTATATVKGLITSFAPLIENGILSISANDSVVAGDGYNVILVTTAASTITVDLPPAAQSTNRRLRFIKVDAGAGVVTLDGDLAETINGQTTVTFGRQYGFMDVVCDGSGWFIEGTNRLATDTEIGLISYYKAEDINLDGSFTSGTVRLVRINEIVTMTQRSLASHPSASNPGTTVGFVPAIYRPSQNVVVAYNVDSNGSRSVSMNGNGQIGWQYRTWSGSSYLDINTAVNFTMSWIIS